MTELAVTDLRIGDVGARVIVTFNGSPAAGVLTQIHSFKEPTRGNRYISLETVMDWGSTKFKLEKLPPEYLIQVEREPEPIRTSSTDPVKEP